MHRHETKYETTGLEMPAIFKQEIQILIIRPPSVKNVFERGHFKHLF